MQKIRELGQDRESYNTYASPVASEATANIERRTSNFLPKPSDLKLQDINKKIPSFKKCNTTMNVDKARVNIRSLLSFESAIRLPAKLKGKMR